MFKVEIGKETVIVNNEMIIKLYEEEKNIFADELNVIDGLNKNTPYVSDQQGLKEVNVKYFIDDIDSTKTIHLFDAFTCNHIHLNISEVTFTNYQEDKGNCVVLSKENIYALAEYFKTKEETK